MTSGEKETVYNLLKLTSSWAYGYESPKFMDDEVAFDDDVFEFEETPPEENAADEIALSAEMNSATSVHSESESIEKENNLPEISGASLDSIKEKIDACRNCILSGTRNKTVAGEGSLNPYVMVIGEGPGEDEDKTGRPFVGKAGQLLDKMLAAIALGRSSNCYITNIVKCRPPMNRTPMIDEAASCSGFLQAQIHILKPRFILAMGRTAVQNLLKTNSGINSLRGQWLEYKFGNESIPLMATYHPSALLRDERLKAPAWQDLKKFREMLLAEKPDYAENFYAQK